jgi:hypothetical protein
MSAAQAGEVPGGGRRGNRLLDREAPEPREGTGGILQGKGVKVYEPDQAAFRKHAQQKYLASDLAKDWPAGMVDKINAL